MIINHICTVMKKERVKEDITEARIVVLTPTVININNTGPVSRDPDDDQNVYKSDQGVILEKMDGV